MAELLIGISHAYDGGDCLPLVRLPRQGLDVEHEDCFCLSFPSRSKAKAPLHSCRTAWPSEFPYSELTPLLQIQWIQGPKSTWRGSQVSRASVVASLAASCKRHQKSSWWKNVLPTSFAMLRQLSPRLFTAKPSCSLYSVTSHSSACWPCRSTSQPSFTAIVPLHVPCRAVQT